MASAKLMRWSEPELDYLRRLWPQRYSAKAVSRKFAEHGWCRSDKAVAAMAQRLGLNSYPDDGRRHRVNVPFTNEEYLDLLHHADGRHIFIYIRTLIGLKP